MIKRLPLLTFLTVTLAVISLRGQDIHFSQFYMSPLTLNPALTGVMNCNTRIVGNYRNQWAWGLGRAAYHSYRVSSAPTLRVGRDAYFGFGGSVWALVGKNEATSFLSRWLSEYRSRFPGREATAFEARPGPGLTWME